MPMAHLQIKSNSKAGRGLARSREAWPGAVRSGEARCGVVG